MFCILWWHRFIFSIVKLKVAKLKTKSIADVQALISAQLSAHQDISLEYFAIRNAKTLAIPKSKREKLVALVAAKIGGVRLIDNMFL